MNNNDYYIEDAEYETPNRIVLEGQNGFQQDGFELVFLADMVHN